MGGGHVQGLIGARVLGNTKVKRMCDTGDNIAGIHKTTMSTQRRDNLLFTLFIGPITDR